MATTAIVGCRDNDDNDNNVVPNSDTNVVIPVIDVSSNETPPDAAPPNTPPPTPTRTTPQANNDNQVAPPPTPTPPPPTPARPKNDVKIGNYSFTLVWVVLNNNKSAPFSIDVSNTVLRHCSGPFTLYFETGAGQQETHGFPGDRDYSFLLRDSARTNGLVLLSEGPLPPTAIRVNNASSVAVPVTITGPEVILASSQSFDWAYTNMTTFSITYDDGVNTTQSQNFAWGDVYEFTISDSVPPGTRVLSGGPK